MRYLNSKDVADILGINVSTLKRWTENGTISCKKTPGGHRKFTMLNIREYFKKNQKSIKNLDLGLENSSHKTIYNYFNNNSYTKLVNILADSSIEADELSVSIILNSAYMKNIPVDMIFDEIVEPASDLVEDALQNKNITHLDAYISRKLITRIIEGYNQNIPNSISKEKAALCINFEDNLPDLGVIMSEVISRHSGYNTFNAGSHAEIGDLKGVLKQKSVDTLIFFLCDRQCCMATARDNLIKTEKQVLSIVKSAKLFQVKTIFGGRGLNLFPKLKGKIDYTFYTFSQLKKILQ
tara:strand:+ start:678 stop:1562 length:885 start_codon:yes stop_codon:yes gene_type:complete